MDLVIGWLKSMKNKPLFFQFVSLFFILILFVGVIFIVTIPMTLKSFFTDEIYQTIEESQQFVDIPSTRHHGRMGMGRHGMMQNHFRSAQHVFLDERGNVLMGGDFSKGVLSEFYEQASVQTGPSQRYQLEIDNNMLFYVITKKTTDRTNVFQISYMWDTYQIQLTKTLLKRMYFILAIVMLAAVSLAILFAKRLVKPIEEMKQSVAQIAKRDWHKKLVLDRKDELGELASSIDQMRQQLKERDEAEQMFLQQVSHDLKTPVMVIRSYAEALKDGIYPTGSIQGTAEVLEEESRHLEKKVKDLLFITKLDFLNEKKAIQERVNVEELLNNVIARLHLYRKGIQIRKQLEPVVIKANKEQFTILFENLIDNALKYAENNIEIRGWRIENRYMIRCANDGEVIDEQTIRRIFQPFVKGKKGSFGLGLSIMKRIVELHRGAISVDAEEGKTVVQMEFPLSQ